MSLLLDALKKAAQQKAEKSSQEAPEAPASDETKLDFTADGNSALEDADDNLQHYERESSDETNLTQGAADQTGMSHLGSQSNEVESKDRVASEDETNLTQLAEGQTEMSQLGSQSNEVESKDRDATEDETNLTQLAEGQSDMSQLGSQTDAVEFGDRDTREDETELTQLAADQTDMSQLTSHTDAVQLKDSNAPEDETELSQLSAEQTGNRRQPPQSRTAGVESDPVELGGRATREDDTDLSDFDGNQPKSTRAGPGTEEKSETEISQPVVKAEEIDKALPEQAVLDKDTDLSGESAAEFESKIAQAEAKITKALEDEDETLLLVEREDSILPDRTSITDQQTPQERREALDSDSTGQDKLGLVETTRHQTADDETDAAAKEQTGTTAPLSTEHDTQTSDSTTNRTDSTTSTQTYAPDNYDRTLIKAPSDDASMIFAGMKSESDVVMTPDYAKKVFHSKSSVQRTQHYKLYAGIAVIILVAISIFGASEFQDESNSIETSLRPLKRDPLPGVIKTVEQEQSITQLAQPASEVNVRTIEIIESAGTVASDGVIVAGETESAETVAVEPEVAAAVEAEPAIEMANLAQVEPEQVSSIDVGKVAQSETALVEPEGNSTKLKISSNKQIVQKDAWLRQAYAAYQAGNDELALTLYNQVLEVDPGNRNALLARAAINVQNNNNPAAIRDYQTLLLANPKDSLAMASLISVASYAPGEIETQLKLMIRDEPESPYLHFALANAYGAQNRWREAQGHYFEAFENNPNDPNYAYNLAVSLEHISQPQIAISYYRRALDNFKNGLATFDKDVVDRRVELLGQEK